MIGSLLNERNKITADDSKPIIQSRTEIYANWNWPSVISKDSVDYASVQDCAGYSLALPTQSEARNSRRWPDKTTNDASIWFGDIARRFLEVNPHEVSNFSTALYNVNSVELPGKIIKGLQGLLASKPELRCNLQMLNDSSRRSHEMYRMQATRLGEEVLEEVTDGFISRLRISIGHSEKSEGIGEIDLVFLHNAILAKSRFGWKLLDGSSESLPEFADASIATRMPNGEIKVDDGQLELQLVDDHMPRSVSEFLDVCYCCRPDLFADYSDHRAVPRRFISWNDPDISRIIGKAHRMGQWVATADIMVNRRLLLDHGVKVIHDLPSRQSGLRILVSSLEPDRNLVMHLRQEFRNSSEWLRENADDAVNQVVSSVVGVCGQKILGAARSRIAAREIIGLAAAISLVEVRLADFGIKPIWISLDDNKSKLELAGKIADAVAISFIKDSRGRLLAHMTVVEAKCVGSDSKSIGMKESANQTFGTIANLESNLVIQPSTVGQQAWGSRLADLLQMRPRFQDLELENWNGQRIARELRSGTASLTLSGCSVVVIHNDDALGSHIEERVTSADDRVFQYEINQENLGRLVAVLGKPASRRAPSIQTVTSFSKAVPFTKTKVPVDAKKVESPKVSPREVETSDKGEAGQAEEVRSPYGKADSDENVSPATNQQVGEQVTNPERPSDSSITRPVRVSPVGATTILPSLANTLRKELSDSEMDGSTEFTEATARNLQAALTDIGMHAEFTEEPTTTTPNGVIVRFKGHATLTTKVLLNRQLDLKTTYGLDVVDVRPGLGQIAVFVAARKRRVVDLAKVWLETDWPSDCPEYLPRFLVGLREDNGRPLWLNLQGSHGGNEEHAPHTLIAGETGSGKGVLAQNILLQVIAFNRPENLKLHLIDPKSGVDYFWIKDAPHLVGDLVSTKDESERVLKSLVDEMNRRYELFVAKRVPKISEYNAVVPTEERLPLILLIHDEMADWMAGSKPYREVVEGQITRLAAKARAAGIHIIMITQRASKDAIPVGIRDNLGSACPKTP